MSDPARSNHGSPSYGEVSPPLPASEAQRRRAARLTALFEVLVCSDYSTQLLLAQALIILGLRPFAADGSYSAPFIFTLSVIDAAVLVGLVLWFLHLHGERARDVLFGRRNLGVEAVLGVVLVPFVLLLAGSLLLLVHRLVPSLHNVTRNPFETLVRSPGQAALMALVAVVGGGIREEVQRAFILHRFEQHLGGAAVGLVLFSFLFGAGHLVQGWDAAIATAVLGATWGVVYLVRRSVAAPMVSHAGFDLLEIIRYTLSGR